MKLGKYFLLAAFSATCVALTGCSSPEFEATKAKSTPIVQELHDKFQLAGYKKSEVKGGQWEIDGPSDPNLFFDAVYSGTSSDAKTQCQNGADYARSIIRGKITYFPQSFLSDARAVDACIAEMLSDLVDNGGFGWKGSYNASPISIQLGFADPGETRYKIEVSTNFAGATECVSCESIEPLDANVQAYLDNIQDYRIKHGLRNLTAKDIQKSGAVATTETAIMTPIADSTGNLNLLHIKYLTTANKGALEDQCYSLKPWSKKIWEIDDPGKPRPFMNKQSLSSLQTFGQFVYNSDCRKDNLTN